MYSLILYKQPKLYKHQFIQCSLKGSMRLPLLEVFGGALRLKTGELWKYPTGVLVIISTSYILLLIHPLGSSCSNRMFLRCL